ncbi:retinol dehydrogenase 13 isoform X1 [Callorhinchus milii]|nr:retinol dehydrogenase 13 isoform X1 [Callorhinchus milii]
MNKYIVPASFMASVIGGAVLIKDYVTGGTCPSKATVSGKTIIITGANTGIGKAAARELAGRGARIIMGCRDMEKCEAAAREIRGESLNHHVYARHLDLASLQSVRHFVSKFNKEEERLDVLINNAAVMRCPHWETEDGFEMQLGVNHLGHFLLTNLLLEKLKKSGNSRIINVSSLAHIVGRIDFNDLNWERKKYDTKAAYCQSKLANVLFTRELAKKLQGSGVTTNAVHPGVTNTELGRHTGMHNSNFSSTMLGPFFLMLVKSPILGAQSYVYLAVAEELEGVSGKYFDVMKQKDPAPQALDDETARRLWEISAKLVKLENEKPTPQLKNVPFDNVKPNSKSLMEH